MSTLLASARPALTELTEQERMFQEAVRDFATSEIAPKAMEMDEAQQMEVSTIGLDLAKNVFQVHGISSDGDVVFNRSLRRASLNVVPSWRSKSSRPPVWV